MRVTVSIEIETSDVKSDRAVELSYGCPDDALNVTLGEAIADAIESVIREEIDITEVMEAMERTPPD